MSDLDQDQAAPQLAEAPAKRSSARPKAANSKYAEFDQTIVTRNPYTTGPATVAAGKAGGEAVRKRRGTNKLRPAAGRSRKCRQV